MSIANTIEEFLRSSHIAYTLVKHPRASQGETDQNLTPPAEQIAKAVLFRDEDLHYTLAILPSNHRVKRLTLNELFDRRLELAEAGELEQVFHDCEIGAIPALGQAYGINVIWDEQLSLDQDVWIEAGDSEHLLLLNGESFERLMRPYLHEGFSSCREKFKLEKPVELYRDSLDLRKTESRKVRQLKSLGGL